MAFVVTGDRARPTLGHRQRGLGVVQGLDGGLLVHAQHHRLLRRVQVEPDNVDELLLKPWVVGQLERLDQARLEATSGPDPLNRSRRDPDLLAIDRQLQRVSPEGFSCWVRRTISSTFSPVIPALRPRPSSTTPHLVSPSSANLLRHARTVTGVTPTVAAILELATPSAAINSTLARFTSRCAAVEDRANNVNDSR